MKGFMNLSLVLAVLISGMLVFTAFTPSKTIEISQEVEAPQKMDISEGLIEGTLGEVAMFAGNFAPRDWAFCDGKILDIGSNSALYSILGTTYGGDGRTSFALPNLTEAEKNLGGVRYIICISGTYPSRN